MFIKHVARTMQQFDELLKYPPIVPPLQFKLALDNCFREVSRRRLLREVRDVEDGNVRVHRDVFEIGGKYGWLSTIGGFRELASKCFRDATQ